MSNVPYWQTIQSHMKRFEYHFPVRRITNFFPDSHA